MKKIGLKILTSKLAKELLRYDHRIIDIKQAFDNPDRSVYIFEYTQELSDYLSERNIKADLIEIHR